MRTNASNDSEANAMDAISAGMNPVPRELMRSADVRQAQAAQQEAQVQRPSDAEGAAASASAQPSAVVTLSTAARGEASAQAAPSPDNGTVEARAVEQARAAAANGDVRNNYSAQRALASYEAMSQVGANAAARPSQPEQPTAPGQREPGVLRT
jgi:S-DNA-T family DNA segregation ATPase FtsK/SpoIIIE